jgi:hypothetical protein
MKRGVFMKKAFIIFTFLVSVGSMAVVTAAEYAETEQKEEAGSDSCRRRRC